MKDQFIPYEQALELKELGFDEEIIGYYDELKDLHIGCSVHKFYSDKDNFGNLTYRPDTYAAPLWQQVFDWFRVNYALMGQITDIEVLAGNVKSYRWSYGVFEVDRDECIGKDESLLGYLTYSEAKLECLKELIKIAKKINGENKEESISNG